MTIFSGGNFLLAPRKAKMMFHNVDRFSAPHHFSSLFSMISKNYEFLRVELLEVRRGTSDVAPRQTLRDTCHLDDVICWRMRLMSIEVFIP